MEDTDINQPPDGSFEDLFLRIAFGVLIFSIVSLIYMILMVSADLNLVKSHYFCKNRLA
jgi:hypothetical protein